MSNRKFYQVREVSAIAFILVIAALIYFGASVSNDVVTFRSDLQERVVDLLTNLIVLVLVIERIMEIFISTWRNPGKNVLEDNLQTIETRLEILREERGDGPGIDMITLDTILDERSVAERQLMVYKEITRVWSVRVGLVIGILLAIAGFRVLESIFDSGTLTGFQSMLWTWMDLLVTAGVIAGGSKGIHTLSNTLGDFFENTSARLKAANRQTI